MRAPYPVHMDATQNTTTKSVLPKDRPDITARNFRAVPTALTGRHWVRQDPYATAFFNALFCCFPAW